MHGHCCSATLFGISGLFRSQTARRRQTCTRSRRVGVWQARLLGGASSRFNSTTFDGLFDVVLSWKVLEREAAKQ